MVNLAIVLVIFILTTNNNRRAEKKRHNKEAELEQGLKDKAKKDADQVAKDQMETKSTDQEDRYPCVDPDPNDDNTVTDASDNAGLDIDTGDDEDAKKRVAKDTGPGRNHRILHHFWRNIVERNSGRPGATFRTLSCCNKVTFILFVRNTKVIQLFLYYLFMFFLSVYTENDCAFCSVQQL